MPVLVVVIVIVAVVVVMVVIAVVVVVVVMVVVDIEDWTWENACDVSACERRSIVSHAPASRVHSMSVSEHARRQLVRYVTFSPVPELPRLHHIPSSYGCGLRVVIISRFN